MTAVEATENYFSINLMHGGLCYRNIILQYFVRYTNRLYYTLCHILNAF